MDHIQLCFSNRNVRELFLPKVFVWIDCWLEPPFTTLGGFNSLIRVQYVCLG